MRTDARRPDELITSGAIARMLGVNPSAVSNWRKRPPSRLRAPFPEPWLEIAGPFHAMAIFVRAEVEAWIADREARVIARDELELERAARDVARLEAQLERARAKSERLGASE